jgi:hypothetical protein
MKINYRTTTTKKTQSKIRNLIKNQEALGR